MATLEEEELPEPWVKALKDIREELDSGRTHPKGSEFVVKIPEYEVTLKLKKLRTEVTFSLHYQHGAAGLWHPLAGS